MSSFAFSAKAIIGGFRRDFKRKYKKEEGKGIAVNPN
jgi:hypothetical protein